MARIETLPSGTLRATVSHTIDGKRSRYTKSGTDRKELELWAAKLEYELSKGVPKQQIPHTRTLGDAVDEWIAEREAILSPKTIREYRGYRRTAFHELMETRLNRVTPKSVQAAINREAATHAPKSVRNYWGLLQSVLKSELPEVRFDPTLPKPQKREMKIPTDEELLSLLDTARGHPIEVPLLLAASAGLRRGEIAAVDITKDIDYTRCTIRISAAYTQAENNEWILKSPKTESGHRTVELPTWVAERIREAVTRGYTAMTPTAITQAYVKLRRKVGIDPGIRFHDLRHYYASLMLSAGVPDKYAMRRMGHSTPNMLKNVYQHIMEERDAEAGRQITAALDKLNRPKE